MKTYNGKKIFSGGWDEDLDNFGSVYETLSKICEVSMEDKF